jgi:hypothetical protein
LIHAAVEAADQAVILASEGTATRATTYQFSSTYLPLSPGSHEMSARANDTELIAATFSLREGMATIVAYSTGDFPVALALAEDPASEPPANMAQIRVFHAIVGQSAVDVCAPAPSARADGAPIIANVSPGSLNATDGAYVAVPSGAELPLQIRAQNATLCHGRIVGTAHGFSPVAGSNYTLVFVGRTTGRHRVALELLFCADPPAVDTSCATLTLEAH